MNKIVLVRPPMVLSKYSLSTSTTPPLAIAYLSGTLRANGYDAQTIDALGEDIRRLTPIEGTVGIAQGLPIDEIVARIDSDAEIICYSAMFSCSWTYDKEILNQIRERFPAALIVAGGEHITACADYVLQDCRAVDLCVLGEGEETLLEIVNATFAGEDPRSRSGLREGRGTPRPGTRGTAPHTTSSGRMGGGEEGKPPGDFARRGRLHRVTVDGDPGDSAPPGRD